MTDASRIGDRAIAWLRTPIATLIVLIAALLAQLPHAAERSTSISSVIRMAIFTAVRQEAERLERVNKSPVADILDTDGAPHE